MVAVHQKLTSLNIFSKFKQIYNYLYFCCNLPVKFIYYLSFIFINKNWRLNYTKTKTAMNAKLSISVICVEAIIYFLLHDLQDCTVKGNKDTRSQMFCKIVVLTNFAKFTVKHLWWSIFSIKILLKKDSNTGVFLWIPFL